jgi:hypothetical protein
MPIQYGGSLMNRAVPPPQSNDASLIVIAGLIEQSIFFVKIDFPRWTRGSSPRATDEKINPPASRP